jgi:hypothetical protein
VANAPGKPVSLALEAATEIEARYTDPTADQPTPAPGLP